jgi:hypothetical protein
VRTQCLSYRSIWGRTQGHEAGWKSGFAVGGGQATKGKTPTTEEIGRGSPLEEVTQDNMFELKNVKAARLWMLPPAVMEVAIELLWEDKLAHPQWPHVFVAPRFMTHM